LWVVRSRSEFFDFWEHFVLDIANYTSIIYIWYEDGLLKPSLVTEIKVQGARVVIA